MYLSKVENYKAPRFLLSPHLETIYPTLFRKVPDVSYERERIETPDDDFLDLDWIRGINKNRVVISHGLEGDSHRPYMRGMARAVSEGGSDVLAWNFRGCSGEMNRTLRFYHSGATDDLELVVQHAVNSGYKHIDLIGFSLGGNLTLKYLGEKGDQSIIHKGLALYSSCRQISSPANFIYSRRFLRNLSSKIKIKAKQMPDLLDVSRLNKVKTLMDFDDQYTAPIHGFKDARDYYAKCSSLFFLKNIKTPVLILNAADT